MKDAGYGEVVGDEQTSAMRSEKEQFPLGMLGQRWFGCESHKHKIHSFNKYLLRFFYIQGTVLGIWDPSVMGRGARKQKTKPKKITALVKVLFQQENQTRSNRLKNKLYNILVGDKCYGNKEEKQLMRPQSLRAWRSCCFKEVFRGGFLEGIFVQRLDEAKELAMQISEGRALQAEGTTIAKRQR